MSALAFLLLGAAVLGGIAGIYWTGYSSGKGAQLDTDKPIIEFAKSEQERLRLANEGLQRDLGTIRGDVDRCNASVEGLKAGGGEIRNAVLAAIAQGQKRGRAEAAARARFEADAKKPGGCVEAKAALGDLADELRRLDGLPPAATPQLPAPAAPAASAEPEPQKAPVSATKPPPKSAIKTIGGSK